MSRLLLFIPLKEIWSVLIIRVHGIQTVHRVGRVRRVHLVRSLRIVGAVVEFAWLARIIHWTGIRIEGVSSGSVTRCSVSKCIVTCPFPS